jgi:cell filamentation protein
MDVVYCYPDSDVLINKLGIRNADRLHAAERKLSALRVLELINNPMNGTFDLKHLENIHGYIFQDIYEWAGKIRTVDIAKGNMFCKVQFIRTQADELFAKLKKENYLRNLGRNEMVEKLAYYFAEINALHPFREGNGRAQREFIRELALAAGYAIRFNYASDGEMLEASVDSFMCDYNKMEELFRKCIAPVSKPLQNGQ